MNRIPRTRFVTLMAAAAGVTAGLGSMAAPAEAQSRTPASAVQAADTLKAKPGAVKPAAAKPAAAATKAAKPSAAAPATAGSKPQATAKPVVSTAPYMPPENDACGEDPDCRNINGGGY